MRRFILIVTVTLLFLKGFGFADEGWEEWYTNARVYLQQVGEITYMKQQTLALIERMKALDRKDYQLFDKLLNESISRYSDMLKKLEELKAPEEFSKYHKKVIERFTNKKKAEEALLRRDPQDTYLYCEDMADKFNVEADEELLRIYEKHGAPKGFIDSLKKFKRLPQSKQ